MVTIKDIEKAALDLGIKNGDTVIIHSSFKSFGPIDGGADTVIKGFLNIIGKNGTLVFPTLCQKDWENVYKNWHMDANSDVGYLTNYFRKLPDAKRSNQATHSVAAIGKNADYITKTHGKTGLRYGIFGDTPFSADSPWEKLYEKNAKVVLIGCDICKSTLRHLIEYRFMDSCLKRLENTEYYEEIKSKVWCYERWNDRGVWCSLNAEYIGTLLEKENKLIKTNCGEAEILCFDSVDFVDTGMHILEKNIWEGLACSLDIYKPWKDKVDEYIKKTQRV